MDVFPPLQLPSGGNCFGIARNGFLLTAIKIFVELRFRMGYSLGRCHP